MTEYDALPEPPPWALDADGRVHPDWRPQSPGPPPSWAVPLTPAELADRDQRRAARCDALRLSDFAPPLTDWAEVKARDAEATRRPERDAEWAELVAEEGDNPSKCLYCHEETRPFSDWAAGAECTVCHGTLYRPPPSE